MPLLILSEYLTDGDPVKCPVYYIAADNMFCYKLWQKPVCNHGLERFELCTSDLVVILLKILVLHVNKFSFDCIIITDSRSV